MADTGNALRTGNTEQLSCPNATCQSRFSSYNALAQHLDSNGTCLPAHLHGPHLGGASRPSFRPPPGTHARKTATYHQHSGYTYGRGTNTFEKMEDGSYKEERDINAYYPFRSRAEWSLGKFLAENLSQAQINRFLTLPWFQSNSKPSFNSATELIGWMETLPPGPKWMSTVLEVEGFKTVDPITFIWRDGLEVVESIFGDPIFGADMSFDPILVETMHGREYDGWLSGQEAHRIQDKLPVGSTIVPVLAASDKTPVTRMTGGLEMHPLFLSIGNIASHVRMAATSHAWRCVAFMPIPKFEVHPDYQTILQHRLWHKCVDMVTVRLKHSARHGTKMADPCGDLRICYTILAAWTGDLPEHSMISGISKNGSPVSEATHKQFGDPHPHPPRTGERTLQRIYDVSQNADPWNLERFQKLAKAAFLNGVHLPFWRDWMYAEPSIFLVPEILHTDHKFFFDHVLKWCKEIGGKELDKRFRVHHKRISVRHFSNGVSHVKQMTGREHREIQRTIVAMLVGLVPPRFLHAIRAIIDFIYQSQNPVHTEASVQRMEASLQEFHAHKDAIIQAGARKTTAGAAKDDFFIPKLELLHNFSRAVRSNGAIMQYTADVSERLLITHCKNPFQRTSKQKNFAEQVVQLLDRIESMRRFDVYTLLRSSDVPLVNVISDEEHIVAATNPALAWVSRVLPEEQWQVEGPRAHRNYFVDGFLSNDALTALHVTRSPDETVSSAEVAASYHLPDFTIQYHRFLLSYTQDPACLERSFCRFAVWRKFRVQLLSTFRPSIILPSQVVQAKPPSQDFQFGCCDAVLICPGEHAPSFIAQVRAIFQPRPPPRSKVETPTYLEQPLIYVQPFHVACTPERDQDLQMWILERNMIQAPGSMTSEREGMVVPLQWVSHAVELVPLFGDQPIPSTVTSNTSQEVYDRFLLNHFADKETYNAVHGQLDDDFLDTEYDVESS